MQTGACFSWMQAREGGTGSCLSSDPAPKRSPTIQQPPIAPRQNDQVDETHQRTRIA